MFFILVILFFSTSVLWAVLTIKANEQRFQDFTPSQKKRYYIAITGVTCISIEPIIIISSYILVLMDTLMYDQAAIGYVVLFLTFPALLAVAIKLGLISLYLKSLRSISYTFQKKAKNTRLMIGLVTLLSLFIYIPVIKFYLLLILTSRGNMFDFMIKLETVSFHPINLIYSVFFIGPLLMVVAALMDLSADRDGEEQH